MAEFGMKASHSHSSLHSQQGGAMDWYTPSSTAYPTAYTPTAGPATSYNLPTSSHGGFNMSSSSFTNFGDEPPLLEELGIDLGGIFSKTRAILLHRLNNKTTEELDMGGALLFVFLLGGLHLLMGKLHFGIILGWSVVHSMLLWFLVNQLAGIDASEAKGLELYAICCLVGYCMAPLAVLSAASLMLPRGLPEVVLAVLCTLWAAATAGKILARRCPGLDDCRTLITLPCMLLFGAFAMLCLY